MTEPCPILGGRELSSCGAARGGLSSAFVLRGGGAAHPLGGVPPVVRTLRVVGALTVPRGAAPRGPRRLRRGSPTFFEESRGKEHQGQAPGPHFYSRSFPLAGFWDCCLWNGRGAIATGILKPIWDAFSRGNILESIFAKESLQIRVRTWGS